MFPAHVRRMLRSGVEYFCAKAAVEAVCAAGASVEQEVGLERKRGPTIVASKMGTRD